jgi:hypothetical protein
MDALPEPGKSTIARLIVEIAEVRGSPKKLNFTRSATAPFIIGLV